MNPVTIPELVSELLEDRRLKAALYRDASLRQLIRDTQTSLRVLALHGQSWRTMAWCTALYGALMRAREAEEALVSNSKRTLQSFLGRSLEEKGEDVPAELIAFEELLSRACEVQPEATQRLIKLLLSSGN